MRRSPGLSLNSGSREPSGPVEGPEISETSSPGLLRRPKTDAMVFSWAPPTIRRVMTWVTRINYEMRVEG